MIVPLPVSPARNRCPPRRCLLQAILMRDNTPLANMFSSPIRSSPFSVIFRQKVDAFLCSFCNPFFIIYRADLAPFAGGIAGYFTCKNTTGVSSLAHCALRLHYKRLARFQGVFSPRLMNETLTGSSNDCTTSRIPRSQQMSAHLIPASGDFNALIMRLSLKCFPLIFGFSCYAC